MNDDDYIRIDRPERGFCVTIARPGVYRQLCCTTFEEALKFVSGWNPVPVKDKAEAACWPPKDGDCPFCHEPLDSGMHIHGNTVYGPDEDKGITISAGEPTPNHLETIAKLLYDQNREVLYHHADELEAEPRKSQMAYDARAYKILVALGLAP